MIDRIEKSARVVSLADTCADAFELLAGDDVLPGQGCLLQIYPATANAQLIPLTEEQTTIGRDPASMIAIDDHAMSRNHAAIELGIDGYVLVDRNSTNGTFVDDELVDGTVDLTGGEMIRLGGTILKFMSALDREANYHAVVHELMTRDSLTQAFNRSYLIPLIERELESSNKDGSPLSILLLDIDRFKSINDLHGHLVGDEVLRTFCERIRSELNEHDMLARFGGEEFVIACPQTTLREAGKLAERIRLAVASSVFRTQRGDVSVTCSIGVAANTGATVNSCDQLLCLADGQLYRAKRNGRNRVQHFDPLDTQVARLP